MKTALLSATLVMMLSWFDQGADRDAFPELTLRLSVNTGQQFVVKPEIKLIRGNKTPITLVDRNGAAHRFVIRSALENGQTVVTLNEEGGRWLMNIARGTNNLHYASATGAPLKIAVEYRT